MVKVSPTQNPNSLYRDEDIPLKCFMFFYKLLHICFGLNFGFIKFKSFCNIPSNLFLVIPSIVICGWSIFENWSAKDPLFSLFRSSYIIQYLLYVLILILIKENTTIYNLNQDLCTIDFGLKGRHASYNWEIKLFLTVFINFMYRLINFIVFTVFFRPRWLVNLIQVFFIILPSDLVYITYSFMFYAVNCRLKKLGILLKSNKSDFLSKQYLYKSIVDIAEQHKKAFDPLLIIELLFNLPSLLASVYFTVVDIHRNTIGNISINLFPLFSFALQIITLTAMPALCAGMLATQAENIKHTLHDLLLQPKCVAEFGEIERFIHYVEARGCQFRVYKLLPLDADLLRMILSFCVTYLIVIIQFANK